jgi:methanogenic corrinoid protein MtbC1
MTKREGDESRPAPLLSIGAAVESLQPRFPDVSQSSLRFLEREGLIQATRTAGGHRLYSDADLRRISQIKSWQREGCSLDQVRERLALRDSLADPALLATRFLRLIEDGELEDARKLVLDAERAGVSATTLFLEVLRPALIQVGEYWAAGQLSVYEEKAISEVCRELVADLTVRHAPDYPAGPLVLAACVEGERHELGLRMVNGILRQNGYRVRYLGADVATTFLLDAVASYQPEAVLLSTSGDWSAMSCIDAVDRVMSLAGDSSSPRVFVGGRMIDQVAGRIEELGAIPFAEDGSTADLASYLSMSV